MSTEPINPTLEAAKERYRARATVLNEPKLSRDVALEETLRAAFVGMPVTFEELKPMLAMTLDAALPRLVDNEPTVILDVYAQGLVFGYYLAQAEAALGAPYEQTW